MRDIEWLSSRNMKQKLAQIISALVSENKVSKQTK